MLQNKFKLCLDKLIELEGGYVIHKNKGESDITYAGIYRKAHPEWRGWGYIDKGLSPPNELVYDFYKQNYWDKYSFFNYLPLQWLYFEFSVNAGHVPAIKILQSTLNTPQTGSINETTLNAYNNYDDKEDLLQKHFMARVVFYLKLADRYPFLKGWLNRLVKSFEFAGGLANESA